MVLAIRRWWAGLAAKVTVALAVCLTVRLLMAQAPAAPSDVLVQEETDAQGYKYKVPSLMLRKSRTAEQKERSTVRQVLTGQTPMGDAAQRLRFRAYFLSYLYPMMTTEEGLKTVAADRQNLFRDLASSKNQEAHKEVVDLTLQELSKIVLDSAYRPTTRYNAMLIISNLNDVEPNSVGATQTLPEPMRTSLPFILQQFRKADNPDTIKLAALLGLSRHLEWENYKEPTSTPMQPGTRTDIIKELTKLAEEKQSPPGRDPEAHIWLRRRAIEALSLACLKKSDADIAATMDKLLKDDSEPLTIRFAVAAGLGRMSLQPPAKIDALATAKELGYLALIACDGELTRAETGRKTEMEREARLLGTYSGDLGYGNEGGPGMPGPGMRPGGGYGESPSLRPLRTQGGMPGGEYGDAGNTLDPSLQDPKHYRVEYLRRRIRQQLYAVQLGLTGGEDHAPPKPGGGSGALNTSTTTATGGQPAGGDKSGGDKKESKGMYAIAKAGAEKDEVDKIYLKVRKIIEVLESAGNEADFYQLGKDMRKEMRNLEAIVPKRAPAAVAAAAAGGIDDAPTIVGSGKAAGKTAPGKAVPAAKGAPAPAAPKRPAAAPGKSASRPPSRPQPNVFGQPR